jgi:5'-nucleotidase
MNALEYDVMTLGNHEFDKGVDELAKFIKTLNFPVISSNINVQDTHTKALGDAGVKPYIILEKYNMAIIGYITKTLASLIAYGDEIANDILDPVTQVQKYVDELHAKGIKRIICLSHNGYSEDIELAKSVSGVGLIVGGHSHSLLLKNTSVPGVTGPYPTHTTSSLTGEDVWIVQAYRYSNYLGHIEIEWSDDDKLIAINGDPILLDQSIPQEPTLKATISNYAEIFASLNTDILTTSTAAFAHAGNCLTKYSFKINVDNVIWELF